ncbi:hypothetical protein [Methylosinus sp. LW4]|uniref:hypothetical protein n=1 Tax=Methylosinus sp. LW4 TaxID=136993 RepID=UPI0003803E2E|nr:hypothetical protein [Methylosinus sp. LW4]
MSIEPPRRQFRPPPRPRKERKIYLDFACNDERGLFRGRATMAHFRMIGARELDGCDLSHDDWERGAAFGLVDGELRMHRRRFPILGWREWHGNWCWNRYALTRADGLALLHAMAASGAWSCDGGFTRICDWWDRIAAAEALAAAARRDVARARDEAERRR